MTQIAHPELDGIGKYEYGWSDKTDAGSNSRRGLNEEVVRDISAKKSEPQWMLDLRLKGLSLFDKKPMPSWGSDLSGIFFDTIKYFVRSTEKQATSWEDLPDDIKNTYDRLGIPEAEKKRLVLALLRNMNLKWFTTQFEKILKNKESYSLIPIPHFVLTLSFSKSISEQ